MIKYLIILFCLISHGTETFFCTEFIYNDGTTDQKIKAVFCLSLCVPRISELNRYDPLGDKMLLPTESESNKFRPLFEYAIQCNQEKKLGYSSKNYFAGDNTMHECWFYKRYNRRRCLCYYNDRPFFYAKNLHQALRIIHKHYHGFMEEKALIE